MGYDINDFLSFCSIKKQLSNNSLRHVRIRFNIIKRYCDENNTTLTSQAVEQFFCYLKNKNLNNNTLNSYYFTLNQIKEYCKDRGYKSDFLDGFSAFKKHHPTIEILSIEEAENIYNTNLLYGKFRGISSNKLNTLYKTLILFLYHTGCRFSEAVNLRVCDLDLANGKAKFILTKNGVPHSVNLSKKLCEALSEWIYIENSKNIKDYVFTNMLGNQVRAQEFIPDLKKRALVAGIPPHKRVYPHLFRHSFATHLLMAGADLSTVATILNHKDIQTTHQNYVHLADESIKRTHFQHPAIRNSAEPAEVLNIISETFKRLRLENDNRLIYSINKSNEEISINVAIRN